MSLNNLKVAGAKHVAKGIWPWLCYLNVASNHLNDTAMFHLSHGQWDQLTSLTLHQNKILAAGIDLLKSGAWWCLSSLYLDIGSLNAETWKVLDLEVGCMPDLTKMRRLYSVIANRQKVPGLRHLACLEKSRIFCFNLDMSIIASGYAAVEVVLCYVLSGVFLFIW